MRAIGVPIPEEYAVKEYHTAEALAEYGPILDWGKVEAQLSMESFLRDGVLVLKGIFTPEAIGKLRASCENVQRQNDSWLEHDWHEPTQWAALGMHPPTADPLTQDEIEDARGGCQLLNGSGLHRIFQSVEANNPQEAAKGTHFGSGVLRDLRSIRWPKGMASHLASFQDFLMRNAEFDPDLCDCFAQKS